MTSDNSSKNKDAVKTLFSLLLRRKMICLFSIAERINGRESELLDWIQLHPDASNDDIIQESYRIAGIEDIGNTLQSITRWIPEVERAFPSDNYVPSKEKFKLVMDVLHSIWEYIDRTPKYHNVRNEWYVILSQNGMSVRSSSSLQRADISKLDTACIFSMFICISSNDRFCPGNADHFFIDGYALQWLKRLEELDKTE